MPKISVLMSVYNNGPYLVEAIDSIRAQSFTDYEFLIIDDCSTDDSRQIMQGLAQQDRRIECFHNSQNIGLANSLNSLIDKAKGDYIARMDGDDIVAPSRFEKQLGVLEASRADVCGTWLQTLGRWRQRTIRYPVDDASIRTHLLFQNAFDHPSIILRTDLLQQHCRYDPLTLYAEDYDLWCRLAAYAKFANIPEVLHFYRLHDQQVSITRKLEQWRIAAEIRIRYLESLKIPANEEETYLHGRLRYPRAPASKQQILAMENWLLKLAGQYSGQPECQKIVAEQWYRLCAHATEFGLWTWRIYMQSPLKTLYQPSKRQIIDLLAASSIGLKYQSPVYQWLEQFSLS